MSVPLLLSPAQMRRIRPHFPLSHGVPHVDDRRVLSGIIFVMKDGLRWRSAPAGYGLHKTLDNRFGRDAGQANRVSRYGCGASPSTRSARDQAVNAVATLGALLVVADLSDRFEHFNADGFALQPREEAADGLRRPAGELDDPRDCGARGPPRQGKHLRLLGVRSGRAGRAARGRACLASQGGT
jgi:putative transposase